MGRLPPRLPDNLDQAAASIVEPEVSVGGIRYWLGVPQISPPVHSLSSGGRQSIVKLRR